MAPRWHDGLGAWLNWLSNWLLVIPRLIPIGTQHPLATRAMKTETFRESVVPILCVASGANDGFGERVMNLRQTTALLWPKLRA
jgi:hypothetical protein